MQPEFLSQSVRILAPECTRLFQEVVEQTAAIIQHHQMGTVAFIVGHGDCWKNDPSASRDLDLELFYPTSARGDGPFAADITHSSWEINPTPTGIPSSVRYRCNLQNGGDGLYLDLVTIHLLEYMGHLERMKPNHRHHATSQRQLVSENRRYLTVADVIARVAKGVVIFVGNEHELYRTRAVIDHDLPAPFRPPGNWNILPVIEPINEAIHAALTNR